MSIYTNLDKAKYGDWSFPRALPSEGDPKREEILSKYGGNTEKFPHLAEKYEGLEREHYYAFIYEALTEANKEADQEQDPKKLKMLRERVDLIARKVLETRLDEYKNLNPEVYGDWTFPIVMPSEDDPRGPKFLKEYRGDIKQYPHLAEEFEGLTSEGYRIKICGIKNEIKNALESEEKPEKKKILQARLSLVSKKYFQAKIGIFNNLDPKVYGFWTFPSVLPPMGSSERKEFLKEHARYTVAHPELEMFEGICPTIYHDVIEKIELKTMRERTAAEEAGNTEKAKILNNRILLFRKKETLAREYWKRNYQRIPGPPTFFGIIWNAIDDIAKRWEASEKRAREKELNEPQTRVVYVVEYHNEYPNCRCH